MYVYIYVRHSIHSNRMVANEFVRYKRSRRKRRRVQFFACESYVTNIFLTRVIRSYADFLVLIIWSSSDRVKPFDGAWRYAVINHIPDSSRRRATEKTVTLIYIRIGTLCDTRARSWQMSADVIEPAKDLSGTASGRWLHEYTSRTHGLGIIIVICALPRYYLCI